MFIRTDVHVKRKKFSMLQHLAHNVFKMFKDVQGHYPLQNHEHLRVDDLALALLPDNPENFLNLCETPCRLKMFIPLE